jgi:hypothetical protein
VLTSEQYATVKAGDQSTLTADEDAHGPAQEKMISARFIFDRFDEARTYPDGFCEVCFKKLGRIERIFHDQCKMHR